MYFTMVNTERQDVYLSQKLTNILCTFIDWVFRACVDTILYCLLYTDHTGNPGIPETNSLQRLTNTIRVAQNNSVHSWEHGESDINLHYIFLLHLLMKILFFLKEEMAAAREETKIELENRYSVRQVTSCEKMADPGEAHGLY